MSRPWPARLAQFGVSLDDLDAAALAVFDHGAAPPGYSDRQFRFDYIRERVEADARLSSFAFRAEAIPARMTRLQAVADSRASDVDAPLMVMDTAPAAVLGAMLDPAAQTRERVLVANVGNLHTLAFRLDRGKIEGTFEHHTGMFDRSQTRWPAARTGRRHVAARGHLPGSRPRRLHCPVRAADLAR